MQQNVLKERNEGREEGRKVVVRSMLAKHMAVALITELTELAETDVAALRDP